MQALIQQLNELQEHLARADSLVEKIRHDGSNPQLTATLCAIDRNASAWIRCLADVKVELGKQIGGHYAVGYSSTQHLGG